MSYYNLSPEEVLSPSRLAIVIGFVFSVFTCCVFKSCKYINVSLIYNFILYECA